MVSANFARHEFECKCGCGYDTVDVGLIRVLQKMRKHFNKQVFITSGCRCMAHNERVGGGQRSQHLIGRAADVVVQDVDPDDVADWIDSVWPDFLGLGRYSTFTHIDSRNTKARWNG